MDAESERRSDDRSERRPVGDALLAAWREHRPYVYVVTALFALGAVAGAALAAAGTDLLEVIADAVGEQPFEGVEFTAWSIFRNNARVFVLSIVLGTLTLGLFVVLVMAFNGLIVGNVLLVAAGEAGVAVIAVAIVPHGVLELPALFVASAVALRLLHRVVERVRGRRESILDRAYLYRTGVLVAVAFVVLAIAAVVEVYVTGTLLEVLFDAEIDTPT